ncbi:membrane-associated guanylate kinase, WW and PDZ domain-containing 3-like isoform X1, partial [Paramuricea clavata]
NGYDNDVPNRVNADNSQAAPGKKVPPPVKPKPKRPNSTIQDQVNEKPAVQQQSYKPVPAPRRSLSTGGTLDRIKRSDEETVSVQLLRGQQGYGFSLRGGQDLGMPLFILRMADGGTAHRDGRLMVGDELIEINGQSTSNMNHSDAIDAIKRGGNSLNVIVRRSSKQAYMTNTLPNGGHNSG